MILTIVLGSSGHCEPGPGTQHWGRVALAETLGDRRLAAAPLVYPPGVNVFRNG